MNYELTLLRNYSMIKRSASVLRGSARLIALRSYDSARWRDGTMGQIAAIREMTSVAERLEELCRNVGNALSLVPRKQRALLVAVYARGADKSELAAKFNVSLSTVYRKLIVARKIFLNKLRAVGLTESVFVADYGDAIGQLTANDRRVRYPVRKR